MENRFSKAFIEDGFSVNININGKQNQLSFQSSATVDHVKMDIIKAFLPANEQAQEYFLALNKSEILQIEFVRFIFSHEDIQKSLLIKKSIEVFLVPKSKEIIARKYKAERIKKQLGTIQSSSSSRRNSINKPKPSGYKSYKTSAATNSNTTKSINNNTTTTSTTTTSTSTNTNTRPSLIRSNSTKQIVTPPSPTHKRVPSSSVPKELLTKTNDLNISNTTTATTTPITTTVPTTPNKTTTTPILEQPSPILIKQDSFDKATTTSTSVGTNPSSSIETTIFSSNDPDQEDENDIIKLQLQQQLVLLEDEELKYQSSSYLEESGTSDIESGREDFSASEFSETEKDKSDSEKESPMFSISPPSSDQSPNIYRKSLKISMIMDGTPAATVAAIQNGLVIEKVPNPLIPDIQMDQLIKKELASPTIDQQQPEQHWTEYLSLKPLKMDQKNIPVHVSAKGASLIINCNQSYTSNEFRKHMITTMENFIQAIKVGTLSTEINGQTVPLSGNNTVFDIIPKPNDSSIPQLTILKPGMLDLYKSTGTEFGSPQFGSPLSNSLPKGGLGLLANSLGMAKRNGITPSGLGLSSNSISTSFDKIQRSGDRVATFALGEQRDVNGKALAAKKKLIQNQIGSLLGKPLCWSNTENEIRYFRNLTEQIFDFNELDARDRVKITLAQITTASADPLLPSNFRARFYLPPDNHSTTINIHGSETVSQIIEKVIAKHNSSTKLISSEHTSSDYVIRITGTSDHVLRGEICVGDLIWVRNRLQRKKDIKFSLVLKASMPDIYIDGFTEGPVTMKHVSFNNYPSSPPQPSSPPVVPSQALSPRNITAGSFIVSSPAAMNAVNFNFNSSSNRNILLYEINRPFEIRIICLENLNSTLFSRYLPDVSASNSADIKLTINVSLCHGEDSLTQPMETTIKPSANPLWCEWLRSELLMCDLPRATRLCFTVYAQTSEKNRVSVGWADLQLIDYRNQLLSGVNSLILWPGDRVDTPDFSVQSPSLVIEFCQFPFPVIFPKPEMMERTEIRDYVESRKEDEERLQEIIKHDSLYKLTEDDKKFIWMYRMHLASTPSSLPKVLQSLQWNNPQNVKEAHRLLSIWAPLSPEEALELLDVRYADELVREYAVNCLRAFSDNQLALYLLQLVQSLKHEPYHDSALARFLIQRALNNRSTIGHPFFWHLEAEMHNPKISERYSLVLETYLKGCGNQRHEFVKQMEVVTKLTTIAKLVKDSPPSKRKAVLQEELSKVSWPNTFHLPISASTEACGLLINECRWLDSFTVPLYLVFQNVDPVGEPISVIFKAGDDLRQDILTLQMISLMDNIWKQNGLDLHLSIYNVTAISEDSGFIEVVPDSDTTANIQKAAGGVTAAFQKTPLANWLRERNQSDNDYEFAVQNFIHSLSGYCVATYILGISDRHNDNIMVSNSGHLFHIDFAHFLGNIMKFHGYKREKAPFVLTPEFAHVMGGEKSNSFKWFTELCSLSYQFLRKHRNLFIILFSLMISTGIPELSTKDDILYLREALLMDLPDEEAAESFKRLIQKSLKTKTTQVMFAMHILAHPDKNE
ncbi:hypothetical protein CYY_005424 [Polysphondylium violaceum]|uniref:Phosphatidylinositol 3-kinase n=1 Tax=Polysphondylium violaceum TaxID=133409 RepID=A0A8J4V468_9MYCE|nr:hypothetical protein CYY_005424 [Polysphondylium violaceum]